MQGVEQQGICTRKGDRGVQQSLALGGGQRTSSSMGNGAGMQLGAQSTCVHVNCAHTSRREHRLLALSSLMSAHVNGTAFSPLRLS